MTLKIAAGKPMRSWLLGEARHLQRNSAEAVKSVPGGLSRRIARCVIVLAKLRSMRCWAKSSCCCRDYANALTDFEAALNLWKEIGDPIGAVEALYGRLGHTLALLDRRDRGRARV